MRTLVIAEMGSTHDANLTKALDLVRAAQAAGADVVKAQYWSSAKRLAERRRTGPTYEALYAKYQMPQKWLPLLANVAKHVGIEFLCTTYLPEDIEVVAPYVSRFKVASFEAQDEAFLLAHLGFGKPLIVSTGMMRRREWKPTMLGNIDITWLHCVSAYPCPDQEANIAAIRLMRVMWDKVGYSDHTESLASGAIAVACGAVVLEKHLRLNETDPGNPDYATALDPLEFGDYVDLVRQAEVLLGDGRKEPQAAEAAMAPYRVKVHED